MALLVGSPMLYTFGLTTFCACQNKKGKLRACDKKEAKNARDRGLTI